jgi:hypothetical protein
MIDRKALLSSLLCTLISGLNLGCTYDSNPPGDEKIHDSKPLVMIDATGLGALRSVQLQYTDLTGSTTLQTSAEKTDASGRFFYPLRMTRGTRSYSLTIIVDDDGNGIGGADKTYGPQLGVFSGDSEVKTLKLSSGDFF